MSTESQTTTPLAAEDVKKIIRAAKSGDATAVQSLLDTAPDLVHARDSDGSTPLHCASWKGHPDVVSLLLDRGADIQAKNENSHWGDTPLYAAAHGKQRAVAEILVERGADLTAKNASGNTPLAETRAHNATTVANFLKKHGATE